MNQSGVLVDADMDFHSVVPLIALLGLVHLGIHLPLFIIGGAGRSDQCRVNDGALPHRHPTRAEVGFDGFIDEVFCEAVNLLT